MLMHDMRNGTCAVCGHTEIVDAPATEFSGDDPIRLAVAHAPDSLDLMETRHSIDRPIGLLRMLVCRSCGFVQWFASKPHKIPIDEQYGTKLITAPGRGPSAT